MLRTFRMIAALGVAGGLAACQADSPTALPTAGDSTRSFPASGQKFEQGEIYERSSPEGRAGQSRYVFHDDTTFTLQLVAPDREIIEFRGGYTRRASSVELRFRDSGGLEPWIATANVRGDSLIVNYNSAMARADFEDGVYVLRLTPMVHSNTVFVASADGSQIMKLTAGRWPAWSPDGKQIALDRLDQIFVLDMATLTERFLGFGSYPAWSPDGKRIAFVNHDGIAVMNADGSGVQTLISHRFRRIVPAAYDLGVTMPAWSPDGTQIAFAHLGDDDFTPARVFVMNADGSSPKLLTRSQDGASSDEADPSWSPDGLRAVLWSFDYGIASVDVNDGLPTSVYFQSPGTTRGGRPTWSAAGSIAFAVRSTNPPAIWVASAAGMPNPKLFIPDAFDPAWSGDGRKIAFVRSPK